MIIHKSFYFNLNLFIFSYTYFILSTYTYLFMIFLLNYSKVNKINLLTHLTTNFDLIIYIYQQYTIFVDNYSKIMEIYILFNTNSAILTK
jgi:hypothetical protein